MVLALCPPHLKEGIEAADTTPTLNHYLNHYLNHIQRRAQTRRQQPRTPWNVAFVTSCFPPQGAADGTFECADGTRCVPMSLEPAAHRNALRH